MREKRVSRNDKSPIVCLRKVIKKILSDKECRIGLFSVELFDPVRDLGGLDGVFKKHGHGHWAYAAGDWRYIRCDGFG